MADHGDGVSRRKALPCMAWAGTGVLWTISGGVAHSLGLLDQVMAPDAGEFTFLQISDSHVGFAKPVNPNAKSTLQEAIGRLKRGGLMFSKHRFLGIQFNAYLANGLWLDMARTANARAAELADGLARAGGAELLYPVEANEVFVRLPENTLASLEAQGFQFYRRGGGVIRLVAGWNTQPGDVASFVDSACKAV
jgi:hypothetical protein